MASNSNHLTQAHGYILDPPETNTTMNLGSQDPTTQSEKDAAAPILGATANNEKASSEGTGPQTPEQKHASSAQEGLEIQYATGARLALISLGLCMTMFVVALDNTIIATAIPKITTVFDSLNDVGWYGSAYLLTLTSLQPSFGKIYTFFDIKLTYLTALVIFEVGSVLCAAATSSSMLIVGRAIAGCGASALFSGGLLIVTFSVPIEKRAIYVAFLTSMFGIASVVGPILGGTFTDKLSWRWCFWINMPFGGVAFLICLAFFKSPKRRASQLTVREKIAEIDLIGAVFLIGGIVCLLLALQWGGTVHSWGDSLVWGLLLGFGLFTIVFIGLQIKRGDSATIPPRLIKQRTVFVAAVYTLFLNMTSFTLIYYLPFYFQAIKGTSAVGSGIHTIPYLVSVTLSSILIGAFITVTGTYAPFLSIGAAIVTVGSGMITTLSVDSTFGQWFGWQVLTGLGQGASTQIPYLAVQAVLGTEETPVGTSIVMFFNTLGGAVAISIGQNIFYGQLLKQIPRYAPGLDPRVVLMTGATDLRKFVPPQYLHGVLQAYAKALDSTFTPPIAFSAVCFFVGLFIERVNIKGKKLMPGAV